MEQRHALEGVMDTFMKNLKEIVDANTVIGDPVTTPTGTVIIPVSKVSFGFASGGSDFNTKNGVPDKPVFGGGSGAGVTLTPLAFLIVSPDGKIDMKLLAPDSKNMLDKAIDMAPGIIDKIRDAVASKKDKEEEAPEKEEE